MIRELKCPYGDDFEGGDECDRCEQYELCMETYPPVNLIEIPKGATNGDMIKAMFPSAYETDHFILNSPIGNIIYIRLEEYQEMRVQQDWWNATYKRGNENG